jgi:cysteine-rich repeat protein
MNRAFFFASMLGLSSLSLGCSLVVDSTLRDGVDSGTPGLDGGDRDAGEIPDGGPPTNTYARFPDGTRCTIEGIAERLICLSGLCSLSTCGDGFADTAARGGTEACDDGNTGSGDGCEPLTCAFTCDEASDCVDTDTCNGEETCDASTHRCAAGSMVGDGTACTREGGAAGACRGGICASVGCGNGTLDSGEECDDGDLEPGDGCEPDCVYSCHDDEECQRADADMCNGLETCNSESHACEPASAPLDCADADACTVDACDPITGCSHDASSNDADGDRYYTVGCGGDDCDDANADVYPGAGELCDGIDNDCDGERDETAPLWYVDCDCDDYAAGATGSVAACERPRTPPAACTTSIGAECATGLWTSRAPLGTSSTDCADSVAGAHPGVESFSTSAIPGTSSYDWDCDGEEIRDYPYDDGRIDTACYGLGGRTCDGLVYYETTREPECGRQSTRLYLSSCASELLRCVRATSTIGTTAVGCR